MAILKPWRFLTEGDRVRSPAAARGRFGQVRRVAWTARVPGAAPGTPGDRGRPVVELATRDVGPWFLALPEQLDWVVHHGR